MEMKDLYPFAPLFVEPCAFSKRLFLHLRAVFKPCTKPTMFKHDPKMKKMTHSDHVPAWSHFANV